MKETLILLILLSAIAAQAQSPTGGSTGADGPLELTTPGVVTLDPRSFSPSLHPAQDNVFQFTTIHIGKDVTVKLSSRNLSGPVFWLAQGPVQIDGIIDVSGEEGNGWPALGGAGGFPGGTLQKPGYGPVSFSLNAFLVPLVGGSGGKGGRNGGGGGGGGALLIASSTSITVNGKIMADGGSSSGGSGGNGGAIRLVTPLIVGLDGAISARGGQPNGTDGSVRLEAYHNQFQGTVIAAHCFKGKPLGLFLPPNPPPSVRLESLDGVVTAIQEIRVDHPAPITVGLEAHNIPTGTVVDFHCFAQDGQGQSAKSSPLVGTEEYSRATVQMVFAKGTFRCLADTAWAPSPATR